MVIDKKGLNLNAPHTVASNQSKPSVIRIGVSWSSLFSVYLYLLINNPDLLI